MRHKRINEYVLKTIYHQGMLTAIRKPEKGPQNSIIFHTSCASSSTIRLRHSESQARQHALVMGQSRQNNAYVEDLMRCKEKIETARCQTLWNAVRAGVKGSILGDETRRMEWHILEQCATGVERA